MSEKPKVTGLARLREPFESHQISKLPKPSKKQTEDVKADYKKGIRCQICGAWHHPDVVHLDYVGHAALTDRLLDADPMWNWNPLSVTPEGSPLFDKHGGLWINLTVCDVTRLGYGSAEGKSGGDAIKEIIGDALRNAAMRFGAALALWHKGDLHIDDSDELPQSRPAPHLKDIAAGFDAKTKITPKKKQTIAEMLENLFIEKDFDENQIVLAAQRAINPKIQSSDEVFKLKDDDLILLGTYVKNHK